MGTNLTYIQNNLPHFEDLLVAEPQQALEEAELVIVTHANPEFRQILQEALKEIQILDLASVFTEPIKELNYSGIAW
jgi:GDP-mannose 6-dehydrogenase